MKNIYTALLLVLSLVGCIEEFDLQLNEIEPRLVVDAQITNEPGPYYVRLTQSRNGDFYGDYNSDNAEPVLNATIIISDNLGVVDTLQPINIDLNEYSWSPFSGYYKFIKNELGVIIDTLFLSDPSNYNIEKGFYKTTHMKEQRAIFII